MQTQIRVGRDCTKQGLINEAVGVVKNVLNRHGHGIKDNGLTEPVHGLRYYHVIIRGTASKRLAGTPRGNIAQAPACNSLLTSGVHPITDRVGKRDHTHLLLVHKYYAYRLPDTKTNTRCNTSV